MICSKEVLSMIAEGRTFEGLDAYIRERQTKQADAALASTDTEQLHLAKGAHAELKVLSRLKTELDTFLAEQRAGEKKPQK